MSPYLPWTWPHAEPWSAGHVAMSKGDSLNATVGSIIPRQLDVGYVRKLAEHWSVSGPGSSIALFFLPLGSCIESSADFVHWWVMTLECNPNKHFPSQSALLQQQKANWNSCLAKFSFVWHYFKEQLLIKCCGERTSWLWKMLMGSDKICFSTMYMCAIGLNDLVEYCS